MLLQTGTKRIPFAAPLSIKQHQLLSRLPYCWLGRCVILMMLILLFLEGIAYSRIYAQDEMGNISVKYRDDWKGELGSISIVGARDELDRQVFIPLKSNEPCDGYWTTQVYDSFKAGNRDIYTLRTVDRETEVAVSEITQITNHPATDHRPRINFDGTRIVFASNRDGDYEIFSMALDGTDLRQLTVNGAVDTMPAWSPDGERIAFVSDRDGSAEIFIMNADGGNPIQITSTKFDSHSVDWSSDGQKLV